MGMHKISDKIYFDIIANRQKKYNLKKWTVITFVKCICGMYESGLVIWLAHDQCSVITQKGGTGFFQDRAYILVYMESYYISVVL